MSQELMAVPEGPVAEEKNKNNFKKLYMGLHHSPCPLTQGHGP